MAVNFLFFKEIKPIWFIFYYRSPGSSNTNTLREQSRTEEQDSYCSNNETEWTNNTMADIKE